jgi:hypothetical protein
MQMPSFIIELIDARAESFTTQDAARLQAAHVGELVQLDGRMWRVTKKTNFNAAVERYYWYNAAEDWILEKLGRFLP